MQANETDAAEDVFNFIFGKKRAKEMDNFVTQIPRKLAYAKLRKQLDNVVDKVKGLQEFGVEQGDDRFIKLKADAQAAILAFQSSHEMTDIAIMADNPALQMVMNAAEAPVIEPTIQEKVTEGASKVASIIIVASIIGTGIAIVIGPVLIAAIQHYYHWLYGVM